MIAFEKYLIDNGYKVSHKVLRGKNYLSEDGYKYISSLDNLYNVYVKGDRRFTVGLGKIGTPVHITYPEIILENSIRTGANLSKHQITLRGMDVIKFLNKYSEEETEELFYSTKPLLALDRIPKPEII